jgi:hypothetical protein
MTTVTQRTKAQARGEVVPPHVRSVVGSLVAGLPLIFQGKKAGRVE